MIKGIALWAAFFVFLYLGITALDMGEYTIALVMVGISVISLAAAPGLSSKKKSDEPASARR